MLPATGGGGSSAPILRSDARNVAVVDAHVAPIATYKETAGIRQEAGVALPATTGATAQERCATTV